MGAGQDGEQGANVVRGRRRTPSWGRAFVLTGVCASTAVAGTLGVVPTDASAGPVRGVPPAVGSPSSLDSPTPTPSFTPPPPPVTGPVVAPPGVPGVPGVAPGDPGRGKASPGYGLTTAGVWATFGSRDQPSRTLLSVPGTGTPLWGDWDGDGVATPGRFRDGAWWVAGQRIGTAVLKPVSDLGAPGDVPVVGDVDGDRRTDRAVFRRGTWLWRTAAGGRTRSVFGRAGDVPVVGDWNGDRRLDLGVVRGDRWLLLLPARAARPPGLPPAVGLLDARTLRPLPTTATTVVLPGAAAPVPVAPGVPYVLDVRLPVGGGVPLVGDWDGDGAATPAVVRDGYRWSTVVSWASLGRPSTSTLRLPSDGVPLAVPTPRDAAPGRCPTASPTAMRRWQATPALVVPPQPLAPMPRTGPGRGGLRTALSDQARYLVALDLNHRLAKERRNPYVDLISYSPVQEWAIRRAANAAFTTAMAVRTAAWASTVGDIAPSTAMTYSAWLVRSLACQHYAVSPGGWGGTWQSPLWAAVAGTTAWYAWPFLPPQVRSMVTAMVVTEADAVARRNVRYWRDRNGVEPRPGNTAAEEMSWESMAPALAAAMMPTHPRAVRWRAAVVQRTVAAFSRPADLTSGRVVNGLRLSSWLRGWNANDDGTVVNRSKLLPDYMQAVSQSLVAGLTFRAAGQAAPVSVLHNAALVYGAFRIPFTVVPYLPPGGPIYADDGSIYFPMGASWGLPRRALFVALDAVAGVYRLSPEADRWLAAHVAGQRALQLRWTDGHTYGPVEEDIYEGGREEYAGQQLATAAWVLALDASPATPMRFDRSSYPGNVG